MAERRSFHDEIRKNKIKSVLLMGIVFIFIIFIGALISFALDPGYFFIIMMFASIVSIFYVWAGYYWSDKIALASVRAHPANSQQHRIFFDVAENMALASGLPMPRLYVMQSEQINAFASGRDPQHAVICVTTGALQKLDKRELEGVVGHEMAHIANFDIRFMTLTAVLVGLVAMVAEIFLRSLWFSSNDRDNKGGIILLVLAIVVAILAPILAQLVSFAISRKREFTADATGVKFTRSPTGLRDALLAIKEDSVSYQDRKRYSKELAPLFISDPFKKKISGLFMTHPPIDERIRLLERM
jgi:heat shock protein HtpX